MDWQIFVWDSVVDGGVLFVILFSAGVLMRCVKISRDEVSGASAAFVVVLVTVELFLGNLITFGVFISLVFLFYKINMMPHKIKNL